MNINNYYHAYLAALQLHLEEIPADLAVFDAEVHRACMYIQLNDLTFRFCSPNHQPPKPGFGLSHSDAIRKLIWDMSLARTPLRLAQNEYFSLRLSHTSSSAT